MIWVLGLIGALVALYMAQPRFKRMRVSAARFFRELPVPRERRFRFSLNRPELSRMFWLQMLALLLLLLAFVLRKHLYTAKTAGEGQGIWVLVDTSASMSTKQGNETRSKNVAKTIKAAVDEGNPLTKRRFRLSLFDLEVRDVPLSEPSLTAVLNRESDWAPRPLGTDLARLRSLPQPEEGFQVTHLLVVTDRPAPDWLSEIERPRIVWRDLSQPVENIGITRIRGARNPLTGRVSSLRVAVEAHGAQSAPAQLRLSVSDPDGRRVERAFKTWARHERSFTSEVEIPAETPGRYQLALSLNPATSAYPFDDTAQIEIPAAGELRVDWRLPDRTIPDTLGWRQDLEDPAFRVASSAQLNQLDPIDAAILIAAGPNRPPADILDFQEGHPLLADINLDTVETLAIPAAALPESMRPVLRREDKAVWLAEAMAGEQRGSRYLLPALPALDFETADAREAFLVTTFFNATRALLAERPPVPLYTLTDPANPTPAGTRIALHPDEGDTSLAARSEGGLDANRYNLPDEKRPFWPIALALMILILTIERSLAAWGGSKWK